jgi:hypothetical protein
LSAGCADGATASVAGGERARIVDALADAEGVRPVTDAVARSHQARGVSRVGWPFTRWLGRLRPDPLRRLHLEREGSEARTSLPAPSEVALARLSTAVRDLTGRLGRDLPHDWSAALRRETLDRLDIVATRLDATVARTQLDPRPAPRWWGAVGAMQWLLAIVAIAGAAWLAILAGLGYLRLGDPGTPDIGEVPVPTAMALGGALGGVVLAAIARPLVALGARRRARLADRRLRQGLTALADDALLGRAAAVVDRHRRFCSAVRRAGSG